jgi:hypothetical protein
MLYSTIAIQLLLFCGTDAEILGILIMLASGAVAVFLGLTTVSSCSSVRNSGKLANILAKEISSVVISIQLL